MGALVLTRANLGIQQAQSFDCFSSDSMFVVNCPACGSAMFMGVTACPCGYEQSRALSAIEPTYWEALRAYWRIYWPTQLFAIVANPIFVSGIWLRFSGEIHTFNLQSLSSVTQVALQFVLGAIGLFIFIHRCLSSPFHGFSISVIRDSDGSALRKIDLGQRFSLWFYLFWRQILAGLLAGFLSMPLNVLVSLVGLRTVFGINIAYWISTLGVILAVGPLLLKMMIGNPFEGFHLEVRRS